MSFRLRKKDVTTISKLQSIAFVMTRMFVVFITSRENKRTTGGPKVNSSINELIH